MTEKQIAMIGRISREYCKSFYMFDIEKMYEWYDVLKNRLDTKLNKRASLVYAIKANPFLTPYMNEKVDYFEVCSEGEYRICMERDIPTEKIVLSGVYKNESFISEVMKKGFNGIITIESKTQYRIIKEIADTNSVHSIRILPRLTSGNQFGMDEDTTVSVIKDAFESGYFKIAGIQYFSGTQKKKMSIIEGEVKNLDRVCNRISSEIGIKIDYIEYGPGFFFDYYNDSDHLDVFDAIIDIISPYIEKYEFALESGRFLAASCGFYVSSIVEMKTNDTRKFILVDGGIHHVNYYGRMLGMNEPKVCHIDSSLNDVTAGSNGNDATEYDVVGSLCTVSDVLLKKHRFYKVPSVGDILVFCDAGAYSCTEAGVLFLSHEMPGIYALMPDGDIKELRQPSQSWSLNTEGME